jgi:hypothetical protein
MKAEIVSKDFLHHLHSQGECILSIPSGNKEKATNEEDEEDDDDDDDDDEVIQKLETFDDIMVLKITPLERLNGKAEK